MKVCKVYVILVHEVLADQVRPATLIRLIAKDGQVNRMAEDMKIIDCAFGELHEKHRVMEIILRNFRTAAAAVHDE